MLEFIWGMNYAFSQEILFNYSALRNLWRVSDSTQACLPCESNLEGSQAGLEMRPQEAGVMS